MTAQLPDFVDKLILDGSKVGWWPDRIAAWQRGEKVPPVTIDCAMTRKCNAACSWCYASLQANEPDEITKDQFFDFLTDAAGIGVKGVSFISDGESTVAPWYAEAVEHAAALGLAVGAGSNGIKLDRLMLERVLPHLAYLRFNFPAGQRKRYAEIMGVRQAMFDTVVQNIRDAMDIVRRDGLSCTVNMMMVLDPKDGDQILPFARLAQEIRPTYSLIKHCADDREGTLGVNYDLYDGVLGDLERAEAMGTRVKWHRIESKLRRNYSQCYGAQFIMQLSGSGLVAPCGFMFNSKHQKLHIGYITKQRFKDIYASPRWKEVFDYLGSDHWDSRQRCGPGCLQNPTNEFLYAYKQGTVSLPMAPPPPHLEFL